MPAEAAETVITLGAAKRICLWMQVSVGRKIEQALNGIGLKPSELDGILVTHEHIDHVKGLGVMARKYGVPIYATAGSIEELKKNDIGWTD